MFEEGFLNHYLKGPICQSFSLVFSFRKHEWTESRECEEMAVWQYGVDVLCCREKHKQHFWKLGISVFWEGALKIHDKTNLNLHLLARMWSATFIKHLLTPIWCDRMVHRFVAKMSSSFFSFSVSVQQGSFMLPSQERDVRISSLKCHQHELLPCQEIKSLVLIWRRIIE